MTEILQRSTIVVHKKPIPTINHLRNPFHATKKRVVGVLAMAPRLLVRTVQGHPENWPHVLLAAPIPTSVGKHQGARSLYKHLFILFKNALFNTCHTDIPHTATNRSEQRFFCRCRMFDTVAAPSTIKPPFKCGSHPSCKRPGAAIYPSSSLVSRLRNAEDAKMHWCWSFCERMDSLTPKPKRIMILLQARMLLMECKDSQSRNAIYQQLNVQSQEQQRRLSLKTRRRFLKIYMLFST
jgi:hypothetical protein